MTRWPGLFQTIPGHFPYPWRSCPPIFIDNKSRMDLSRGFFILLTTNQSTLTLLIPSNPGRKNMINKILVSALLFGFIVVTVPARADSITVGDKDTIEDVLTAQSGKRVSIKIKSGQELTGTVRSVSGELTHLGEIAGKEYFDAVVINKAIEAVIIRVK